MRNSPIPPISLSFLLFCACMGNEVGLLEAEPGDLTLGEAPHGAFDARFTPVCGFPNEVVDDGRPGDSAMVIDRQPYLQRVTDRGAWVLWTAEDAGAEVEVSLPDGTIVARVPAEVDATAPLPEGRQWVAQIDDLEASQSYCYRIWGGDGQLAHQAGFATAPETGSDEPVRFVAFGDLGVGEIDQFAVLEQLQNVEFDLALITGDVAYEDGTLAQFEANVFDVYAPLLQHIPFFPASGNHDYGTADAAPFRQVFALFENGGDAGRERWYSFDWGMLHVAVIDTEKISDTQVAWLDADLAATDQPWLIVVGHRPPYSSGAHGSDTATRDAFIPVIEKYGVDLTLWGHDHNYERIHTGDGIKHIVTGAGGRGTRPVGTSSWTEFSQQVSHLVYFEVDAGSLRAYAVDATGATFDTFELRR